MIYKLLLGYFRARFFGMILTVLLGKSKGAHGIKQLNLVEYVLAIFNAYLAHKRKKVV
ncbi:MAG: hypothetical protein P4L65_06500 [Legionella sp.]|nr:hypothetical protein [Legionella sp.]